MSSPTSRTNHAQLPKLISLAPAPCRLIQVDVFKHDPPESPRFSVGWLEVVGILCLIETEYSKRTGASQDSPHSGVTHKEMLELGWQASGFGNQRPTVWPVFAGGNDSSEYGLRVGHERDAISNVRYSTIVRAGWPASEDRENAIKVGRELIKSDGNMMNWADLPDESDTVEDAA
jgi:hypothetical protein